MDGKRPLSESALSRRHLLQLGAGVTLAASQGRPLAADALDDAVANLDPYFTAQDDFQDVSRGKPLPHKLPDAKKKEVGLTRESWQLSVISDPEHPAELRRPMQRDTPSAFRFHDLMELARTKAQQVEKVMCCLNIRKPLGMGLWEGVPLREVLWRAEPKQNVRRVFYYGYHNDDPKQMFRSSLSVDRILEDPHGLPPVLLCYKLNGQFLTNERGGPVRVLVPEAYGFKSIKWLSHLVLTNLFHANDTYASGNNDVASALKTFAATSHVPKSVKQGQPIPVTGFAQVGTAGLSKVQTYVTREEAQKNYGKYFVSAPWEDAQIILPPKLRDVTKTKTPAQAARPLTRVFWKTQLAAQPPGDYVLRCRTVDANGNAQPMPRPFRKSGHAAIEEVSFRVEPI